MKGTFETQPEGHGFACVLCMSYMVKGDRRADWKFTYDLNGGGTDYVCDNHMPEYAKNLVKFRRFMND